MLDKDTLQDAIERIARIYERHLSRQSPFHLNACGGCGGPTFQQPCPLCSFYPMGPDKGTWHPKECSQEYFCKQVKASWPDGGNIGTWLAKSTNGPREKIAAMAEEMSRLDIPAPADIFDLVTCQKVSVNRPQPEGAVYALWTAIFEMRGVDADLLSQPMRERVAEYIRGTIEDIHSDEIPRLVSRLSEASVVLSELCDVPKAPRGNLIYAKTTVDQMHARYVPVRFSDEIELQTPSPAR